MAKILVIDDVADIRDIMSEILLSEGHEVIVCERVDNALEILKSEAINIVITDLYMPVESGFSLIRKVAANASTFQSPKLVAITGGGHGLHNDNDHDHHDVIFADAFIKKPFTRKDLIQAVDKVQSA